MPTPRQTALVDLPDVELVVVGAGGHGREVLDAILAARAGSDSAPSIGVVDDDPACAERLRTFGVAYLGPLSVLEDLAPDTRCKYVLGVGSEAARAALDARFSRVLALRPAVIVHPAASIGIGNDLAPGVVLLGGARVTTNVRLGRHTHVNVNASVSHDCVIGDHTTISPGAVVAGTCTVGDRVLIGAGATLLQGRTIGDDARIGAGGVVVDDVPPGVTVVGVPARPRS